MQYRRLGRSGVMVSPLCLGTMNFGGPTDESESIAIVERSLAAGINFIDTANVYNAGESERIVGKALRLSGARNDVVLATKVFSPMGPGPNQRGGSRLHIIEACEASLRRLEVEHIDLYQLHRAALDIPQDETLRAFDDLISAGKVRYIGASTHPAWVVMEALAISEKLHLNRYVSEQPPYNLLDRRIENELLPLCERYDLAVLPWSPVAGGVLTGRYTADNLKPDGSRADRWGARFETRVTPRGLEVVAEVARMAAERQLSTAALALLWVKDQPLVTAPIYGPRTLEHLEDALPVLEMTLADEDRPLFDALVHPGNVVADFHDSNNWMKGRVVQH
ncbi:MAG: aldo/keto reductase [Gammaproteobacteria bacterium]|nr:MAG: aldo/keto reductase [Gammaproteobacteria bacterium]TDJ39196.1 MAG: aldo/keto reductase [Gammaproteobacteria bacterium]